MTIALLILGYLVVGMVVAVVTLLIADGFDEEDTVAAGGYLTLFWPVFFPVLVLIGLVKLIGWLIARIVRGGWD